MKMDMIHLVILSLWYVKKLKVLKLQQFIQDTEVPKSPWHPPTFPALHRSQQRAQQVSLVFTHPLHRLLQLDQWP